MTNYPDDLLPTEYSLLEEEKMPSQLYDEAIGFITNSLNSDKNVAEIDFRDQYAISLAGLTNYATLDFEFLSNIEKLTHAIGNYAADHAKKRPLNFLMIAEPGTGKSHLVKCIANNINQKEFGVVTYNMTSLRSPGDLISPIDMVRNLKVEDKLPILFLDEFDSDQSNIPLLLPLMWDGELNAGQHSCKVGKVIIILAGSDESMMNAVNNTNPESKSTAKSKNHDKTADFLSRINGGIIEIPGFIEENRKVDKVCIALSLIQARFGKQLKKVPKSLLKFILDIKFQYGIRSLEQLIGLIHINLQNPEEICPDDLRSLPLSTPSDFENSSLKWHLKIDGKKKDNVVIKWEKLLKDNTMIVFSCGDA